MVTEQQVRHSLERHLEGTTHFLVDVAVRPGPKVVVEVDNDKAITLEELARLNKAIATIKADGTLAQIVKKWGI
jgi:ABC-type amino acid transport substrate-binding protein